MVMKKCCGVIALKIAIGITMLALLLAGGAEAATITVNASGGGDYSRIQDAIDNASAGDTIFVFSGIYHENVNVTKQLTLRGVGNPVVDAGGRGSAITLSANEITLERFTAAESDGYYSSLEAGIKVPSSNNNTLTGNNASNNIHGILLEFSSNNTLSGNNGGIVLSSSSNNMMSSNNASSNKKGIVMYYSSNNKIYNNFFNNSDNFDPSYSNNINTWNTKKQPGTNIIGGPIIGGNFWGSPNGTGFSQTCKDMNNNGICEKRYILDENNIDYLPLSLNFTKDKRHTISIRTVDSNGNINKRPKRVV